MHPVHEYARRVVDGEVPAGEHVLRACKRHLADLERGDVWFHEEKVDNFAEFCRRYLILETGPKAGEGMELMDWQLFVAGSILGWKRCDDNLRKHSLAYVEASRGSMKSSLAAAFMLYFILMEPGKQEIYNMANSASQAAIVMNAVAGFVRGSEALSGKLNVLGGSDIRAVSSYKDGSFIHRMATNTRGRSAAGFSPDLVVVDELADQDSDLQVQVMTDGAGKKENSLVFVITNSGFDLATPAGVLHDAAVRMLRREEERDELFAYVCSVTDAEAGLITDPSVPAEELGDIIVKTNPSYPLIPSKRKIGERIAEARTIPSKAPNVLRSYFNVWTSASSPWLDMALWKACEARGEAVEAQVDRGSDPCYLAVDLSKNTDFTAVAAVWVGDYGCYGEVSTFIPQDGVELMHRSIGKSAPLHEWVRSGELLPVSGRVVNLREIAEFVHREYLSRCNVQGLVCDTFRRAEFRAHFDDLGVNYALGLDRGNCDIAFGAHDVTQWRSNHALANKAQADERKLYMPASVDAFEKHLLEGRIGARRTGPLRWAAANVVATPNTRDDRRLEKGKLSKARVDAIIALVMATGYASREKPRRTDVGAWFDSYMKDMPEAEPAVRV